MKTFRNFTISQFLICALAFHANADVFVRTTKSAATLNTAGGMTVYSASAEINGLPVTLSVRVYSGDSQGRVSDALEKTARSGQIVIPSPIGPTTIVITIDGATFGGAPSTAGIPDIPDFTPVFSAFNHDTKTRMVTGASPFPPEGAMRSATASFARQGWAGMTPGAARGDGVAPPSAAFFTKGKSVALVSVSPRADNTSSLVVMVKSP